MTRPTERRPMASRLSVLALTCALFTYGCGDPDGVLVEFDHPPAAQVRAGVFTGDFVDPAESSDDATFRSSATLDLGERDGQLLSTIRSGGTDDAPTYSRTDPGVFKVRANVVSANGSDHQVGAVRMKYQFSVGEYVIERPLDLLVRGSDSRVMTDVELVAGLGELAGLDARFSEEARALGGSIITVPVEVSLTRSGSDDVFSNTYVYAVTMCQGCVEITTQPYALGRVDAD